jgi:drug/metabolite transporter (DMT)-like permease
MASAGSSSHVSAFAALTFTSTAMTLGNKWLMMQPSLQQQTQVVVVAQNLIAVLATSLSALAGLVSIAPITQRQLQFYSWDALVLAVQLWTSFKALQYLTVSSTTVCRSLAIPIVAWLELLVLGTRLDLRRHIYGWLVVAGAFVYAYEDVVSVAAPLEGYLWALANLTAFCSNSVLDKIFMSSLDQSPAGMAMITQLISLPISFASSALFEQQADELSMRQMLAGLEWHTAAALVATGALAAALGRAYAQCYKIASATAVTVAGNVNKMLAILLSVVLFDARTTPTQGIGMGLCLSAAFCFSLAGLSSRGEKEAKTKGA